ncbi:MAG: hypothetical protein JO048_16025 [Methylobacteriaceae bacterium]|nr:hypothetical protein [Methylobacteriaceae bacterium]
MAEHLLEARCLASSMGDDVIVQLIEMALLQLATGEPAVAKPATGASYRAASRH